MDQGKVGEFIARMRKEKGFTQAQLGERLGVTNKTVSRWETGKYMLDISMLAPLCGELGVSIHELLNGSRLSDEQFREAADRNLLLSLKESKKLKVQKHMVNLFTGGGVGILIGQLNAPESPERATLILFAFTFFAIGQLLRGRYDQEIWRRLSG
ncbi:MAG TPA: helix-turn-helix domain-containing protein, partial [Candidatus Dorea gallistercoris]|nr:helix-turn-helix domain-containing protein [Candidatus Dorea gallistercoris]